MSALMEMFTAHPQLSAADRRQAVFEGRQFAKAASTPSRRGPSSAQIAFAHRSLQHMKIAKPDMAPFMKVKASVAIEAMRITR